MKFYFWQNTNSIHQSEFLKSLSDLGYSVTLIFTESLSEMRIKMGWGSPDLSNVEVIDGINDLPLHLINNDCDSIHVFSGINAFSGVHKAFLEAINKNARIALFTEPLDFRGYKGFLRCIRGYYHKLKYGRKIEFIITTGKKGTHQFNRWGYDNSIIFEWGYSVHSSTEIISAHRAEKFKIVFVGGLIKLKGYDVLIKAVSKFSDVTLDLYCLPDNNLTVSESTENIKYLSFLPNDKLRSNIKDYDLLVLPSRYDGWGAIINESLMEGTPVLVSKFCGSSTLIVNNQLGDIINDLTVDEIYRLIFKRKALSLGLNQRNAIREWAENNISGHAMAKYFTEIVSFVNKEIKYKPEAPWLTK